MPGIRTLALAGLAALLSAGTPAERREPTAFSFEPSAISALHALWEASVEVHAERVACLASTISGDTVRVSEVWPLPTGRGDSLGVSALASIETCGPPRWQGTVHTHVALYDGVHPYSLFSGADRGVMTLWWRRWHADGVFCLLYTSRDVICELNGERGVRLFPRGTY